ncbi:MAG: hypothetical protein DMG57_20095 [Acidobacteria bacterium]|nr:MAG: hypothetical protein DMG57_20095 [Acidobacteriota bacterium]
MARDSEDGKSILMQPMVRSLILVLLSQILRPHGEKLDAELLTRHGSPAIGSCTAGTPVVAGYAIGIAARSRARPRNDLRRSATESL